MTSFSAEFTLVQFVKGSKIIFLLHKPHSSAGLFGPGHNSQRKTNIILNLGVILPKMLLETHFKK